MSILYLVRKIYPNILQTKMLYNKLDRWIITIVFLWKFNRYAVDCQNITDSAMKFLAHLRQLAVINIADCVRISDAGVRHLVEGNVGGKIRELNLTNCVRVSDVSLLRISQKFVWTRMSNKYCWDKSVENLNDCYLKLKINQKYSSTCLLKVFIGIQCHFFNFHCWNWNSNIFLVSGFKK